MISAGPSIKRLARFVNGYPFKPDDLGVEGYPVIRIRQLVNREAEVDYADPPAQAIWISDGDLVFSWSATLAVQTWDRGPALLNQHLYRVDPRPGVESNWLQYVLEAAVDRLKPLMHGSAMTHITQEMLWSITVDLPAVDVQRVIADFLDTETARIDAVARRKGELAQLLLMRWTADLCATLLPEGLDSSTGRTTKSHWGSRPLRRLLELSWGGDWGEEPGESEAELPCVRAADFDFVRLHAITGASRSFTRASASTRALRPGDLVIEKSGGGEGVPVGRVVAWRGDGQAVPTNFAGGLRPATDVDPDFLLLAFRAVYEVGLPWRSIKQTTGLQNLDLGHYLSHHWPVPSLPDQKAIARDLLAELDRVLAVQEKLREQVILLQEHRQALITTAVTGELEVPGVAA